MNKVTNINASQTTIDVASEWVAKLDRELTSEETLQLKSWLDESEKHKTAFLKLVALWDKMESLSRLSELFEPAVETKRSKSRSFFGIAASLALISIVFMGVLLNTNLLGTQPHMQTILYQTDYSTKVGEQATFYLQDQTALKLNTNSVARVTYTDKQRLIELVQGELFVEVAHNAAKPLSVHARGTVFQATGTAFNVELLNNKVEMIVTDGRVLVSGVQQLAKSLLEKADVRLSKDSLAVVKGQKVRLSENDKRPVLVKKLDVDIASDLAWQEGELVFSGESLYEAMQEVSRYTEFNFKFSQQEIKQLQIAGLFKTDDVDGLLKALEYNFDIISEVSDNRTVTLSMKEKL